MAEYTEADLKKIKLAELRELAEDHGFDTDEKHKKQDLIDYIIENPMDADDVELEDDELDDEVEEDDELDDEESADEDDELDDEEEDSEADDDELDEDELEEEEPEPKKTKKAPAKKPAKAKKEAADGEATLAAKQVAALLNTDPKTLRQFLRSPASTTEPVGSGGRYEFLESDVDGIRNEFATWSANKATRKPKGEGGTTRKKKDRVIPEEEIAPEIEELDDELDELEDELDELDDELDDDELDD